MLLSFPSQTKHVYRCWTINFSN